ncbi:MAG: chorismate lyase [Thiobacillus sp.]|uniref:chorismate--pyruvate lyase family protein n=1 Tax=Thiobacillus sp. TaxID=924 RepID=UPI002894BA74|nr:chorismate lyase [Thiobacillus sp.]MDT3708128.1 chorismate lyase [Thiobacillus sp.]
MTASLHDPRQRISVQHGWLAHPFRAPRALRGWLSDRGSLTRRLKARYPDFRVRPVASGFASPFLDEARVLHLAPKAHAYVRDVLLIGDGRARVFAHSVLPRSSLAGGDWCGVTRLGTKPLGETLFTDPRIRRLGLMCRRLDVRHPLYRAARRHTDLSEEHVWARRSVFCLNGRPLLVTEVFLPAIDTP